MEEDECLLVLWLGIREYSEFYGTFEEAIEYVKSENRWDNYGRNGAIIVQAKKMYQINEDTEKIF